MKIDSFSKPYLSQYRYGCLGARSLDSPQTLALIFGHSECMDQPRALATAYPHDLIFHGLSDAWHRRLPRVSGHPKHGDHGRHRGGTHHRLDGHCVPG